MITVSDGRTIFCCIAASWLQKNHLYPTPEDQNDKNNNEVAISGRYPLYPSMISSPTMKHTCTSCWSGLVFPRMNSMFYHNDKVRHDKTQESNVERGQDSRFQSQAYLSHPDEATNWLYFNGRRKHLCVGDVSKSPSDDDVLMIRSCTWKTTISLRPKSITTSVLGNHLI